MPVEKNSDRLVSVIIPNYNHGRFVSDAINSVLRQDYPEIEIIVVDDGSTDDSRDVIMQFGNQVKCIFQKNAGLSAARNTGIQEAQGSFVAVLDADDMYEPVSISTFVSALEANKDADGAYCGYQFVDQGNNLLPQVENRPVPSNELYAALLDGNFFVPESIFLRRYVYEYVGLFDETLRACEDWDVWMRVAKQYKVIHVPDVLTRHRVLAGSMSTDPLRMLDNRLAVLKKHVGDEPLISGSTVSHRAYGRAYLGSCVEYLQYGNKDRAYYCFQKMANICPGLLIEVDTFYQLGCGDQPKGHMGDLNSLNVKRNSIPLLLMMRSLFADAATGNEVSCLERASYAKLYHSLGLLAYNTREFREARRFFTRAIMNDFKLLFNRQVVSSWVKSWLNPRMVDWLKNIRQRVASI